MTVKLIIHAESGTKSYLKLAIAYDIVQFLFLALLLVYLRIEDRDRVSIFLSQKLESSIFKKFDLFDHSTPEPDQGPGIVTPLSCTIVHYYILAQGTFGFKPALGLPSLPKGLWSSPRVPITFLSISAGSRGRR